MPIIFAHPMAFAPCGARARRSCYSTFTPAYACAPCSPFFGTLSLAMLFAFVLPALVRMCLLLIWLFWPVVMVYLVASIVSSIPCESSFCAPASGRGCSRTCGDRPVEKTMSSDKVKKDNSVRSASTRRRDLSTVRVVHEDAAVRISVAVPGVKAEHLHVDVLEDVLHIRGETTMNGDVFCVDRSISVPRDLDAGAAEATHEDGELVLVVPRKTGTRIPVGRPREHVPESQAPTPVVAEAPAEQDEMEDAAAAADSSAVTSAAEKASAGEPEDVEWESLPRPFFEKAAL